MENRDRGLDSADVNSQLSRQETDCLTQSCLFQQSGTDLRNYQKTIPTPAATIRTAVRGTV